MNQTVLLTIGASCLIAILADTGTYLRSRLAAKKAGKTGKDLPSWEWERLVEKGITGLIAGLTGAGLAGGGQ